MNLKNINPIKSVAFFVVIGLLTACNSVTLKKADDAMLIKQYAIAADMYDQLASNSSLTKGKDKMRHSEGLNVIVLIINQRRH